MCTTSRGLTAFIMSFIARVIKEARCESWNIKLPSQQNVVLCHTHSTLAFGPFHMQKD